MSTYDGVRTQLREKLENLLRRVEKMEGDLKSVHVGDPSERVSGSKDDDMLAGLDATSLAQVQQTREALWRIDSGSYGTCSTCGQSISAERLAALPTTVTCANCAT